MPSRRSHIIAVVIGIGIGSAATLIAQHWFAPAPTPEQSRDPQTPGPPPTPAAITTDVLIEGEPILGRADAPVTVLEFSDFECPYCRQFHDEVMQKLQRSFIGPGLVRFVHKDLPLPFHRHTIPAAAAARCAEEQSNYWEVYAALYNEQSCLGCKGALEIAGSVVADRATLEACMKTQQTLALIEANRSEASLLGIQATPTFVIGPTIAANRHRGVVIEGAVPWPAFREAIDTALEPAEQRSTPENEGDTTSGQAPP